MTTNKHFTMVPIIQPSILSTATTYVDLSHCKVALYVSVWFFPSVKSCRFHLKAKFD